MHEDQELFDPELGRAVLGPRIVGVMPSSLAHQHVDIFTSGPAQTGASTLRCGDRTAPYYTQ